MKKNNHEFNILICGTGGQGLITLLQIIAEAALNEGYEVRTSELHGLSQRGGSVEVHIRFGKKIYSPLIAKGKADLILALEMQESLRTVNFVSSKTVFLINKQIIPIPLEKQLTEKEVLTNLKKFIPKQSFGDTKGQAKKVEIIPAAEICEKNLGTNVVSGIYLLSLASFRGILPLKPDSILNSIKKIIPEKYLELNIKTFNLAKS